jgi:hypothetical protein
MEANWRMSALFIGERYACPTYRCMSLIQINQQHGFGHPWILPGYGKRAQPRHATGRERGPAAKPRFAIRARTKTPGQPSMPI